MPSRPATAPLAQATMRVPSGLLRQLAVLRSAVAGREGMTYAAVMEASEAPPGIVIADKLTSAFARAGLGPK